jgi:hypothetical protein
VASPPAGATATAKTRSDNRGRGFRPSPHHSKKNLKQNLTGLGNLW